MSDLEKFINAEDSTDHLIRISLIHYQFETIHPFLDGNGRIGRLIITLYLTENHVLSSPALYLSWYLKQNRIEYYDRMSEVRRTGNYEQWIKFFLRAVARYITDFCSLGILQENPKENKSRIYAYEQYLHILRENM